MTTARQVPAFDAHEFAPRTRDYMVAIFVINENGRLHTQLERMRDHTGEVDIVIADGGSTDGSTALEVLGRFGVNTRLVKQGSGRLGAQMRMAFAWGLDRGYRGVVTIDGNNKDGPEAIPTFVDLLRSGVDYVQGSRFVPGGRSEHLPLSRHLGVRLLHAPLLSWKAGVRYTDTTNGFRGFSARLLADPAIAVFRDIFAGYELHYYLAVQAARRGYRVVETPVTRRYPPHGPIPSKISPVRGNVNVLRCLARTVIGYYDP
jgi:dolichol-phosphate mannosyltransferase